MNGVVVCGSRAYACVCALAPGHDGPHECGNDQGIWEGEPETDTFHIIRLPLPFDVATRVFGPDPDAPSRRLDNFQADIDNLNLTGHEGET